MGAFFDNAAAEVGTETAEHHWGKEEAEKKLALPHRLDDGVTSGVDALNSGKKAYEAGEKGDAIGAAKYGTQGAADVLDVIKSVSGKDKIGYGADVLNLLSKEFATGQDVAKGDAVEAVKDGSSTASSAFKLVGKATDNPLMAQLGGGASAIGDYAEALKYYQQAFAPGQVHAEEGEEVDPNDHRRLIDKKCDAAVLGTSSVLEAGGKFAAMAGPEGKAVEMGLKVGAGSMKLADKGLQVSGELGLHGKDREGHNRRIDDVVADKGNEMHDLVHDYLGDGTMSDVLSHAAGGATMLSELPGAGAEAAGLGVYGYAKDAYNAAGSALGTVKDVVTNSKVQEFCANMFMGRF
jgi:hypothetical protein